MQTRLPLFAARLALLALALTAAGCDDDPGPPQRVPVADAAITPPAAGPLTLRLTDRTSGLLAAPEGPFRLVAEELRGQHMRIERAVAERIDAFPHTVELDPLPPGTWRLTVYVDRAGDGAFDGCPFPPEPAHSEWADRFDNLVGEVDVQGGRPVEAEVALTRRICGPGDVDTGIEGRLRRPEDPALDGVPIRALLTPLDAVLHVAEDAAAPRPQPLRVPLFPAGAAPGASDFRLGELVPGRYRLDLFADDDGDRTPSPCAGDAPGGADRYVAHVGEVEVVAGAFTAVPAVDLVAAPCPDRLTGLTGDIELDLPPDHPPLEGALRVELTAPEDGTPIASTAVADTLHKRPLPQPFTVSGLPPGTWRVHVFLDRDGDRRFSPCHGGPFGFDHVRATLEDVVIAPGDVLDLGPVVLTDIGCEPAAGLSGRVEIEPGPEHARSARPVRLTLSPLDGGGEPHAVALFNDHLSLDDTGGVFGRRVPAGRYRGQIYVDTDRSGTLTTCEADPFGDRAISAPFEVDLAVGDVLELPVTPVLDLGCGVPEALLAPVLLLDALATDGALPATVTLSIREEGGWQTTRAIALDDALAVELSVDPIALPPGQYRVAAFVDADEDGELDACDEFAPDPYQARVELTLGAMNAVARPALRPLPCDR